MHQKLHGSTMVDDVSMNLSTSQITVRGVKLLRMSSLNIAQEDAVCVRLLSHRAEGR